MAKSSVDKHFEEYMKDPEFRSEYYLLCLAKKITKTIKDEREKQGLSQEELAKKLGTKQSRVSQMEDPTYGKFSLKSLVRVAEALGCQLVVSLERS